MANPDAYAAIRPLKSFRDCTNLKNYHALPMGWNLIIADIKMSTQAIKQGRYKDVNTVGASTVIAVLNAVKRLDIPFVFGGDGATLAVPDEFLPQTCAALLATQQMAKEAFKLHLRVGIVPVKQLADYGSPVLVAKFRQTPHHACAVFAGDGIAFAEHLVKEHPDAYALPKKTIPKVDFSGLSCHWEDIKSPHGETVTLIVKTLADDARTYRAVLGHIKKVYGSDAQLHPIREEHLHLVVPGTKTDIVLHGWRKTALGKFLYKAFWNTAMGAMNLFMKTPITWADINFKQYKKLMIATTDYKKFDGALRMVMAGNAEQRKKLKTFLDTLRKQKKIAFGLHVADRALMTCIVFELYGRQIHFIDGADGGYAMAAVMLKRQMHKS